MLMQDDSTPLTPSQHLEPYLALQSHLKEAEVLLDSSALEEDVHTCQ